MQHLCALPCKQHASGRCASRRFGIAQQVLTCCAHAVFLVQGGAGEGGAGAAGEEEELDAGEAFERMQLGRITATDPDSAAYHAAAKKTLRGAGGPVAGTRSQGAFGGSKAAADALRRKEYEALINQGLAK